MKKVDSSVLAMDSKETSANAERYPLFSKEATLCHAVQAPLAMTEKKANAARDDRKTQKPKMCFLTTPQDSRIWSKNKRQKMCFVKNSQDFRIFDEKAGLRRLLRGDKTDSLSHKQKASSLLYRKKTKSQTKQSQRPQNKKGF